MSTQFSVAILAGGSSRRMGTDKALMDFGGLPLIARAIAAAVPVTDDPFIVASAGGAYAEFGLPVHADTVPDQGPLAGLLTGLLQARHPIVVVLACDLPFVPPEMLRCVTDRLAPHQAAVPRDGPGRLQPLCAAYSATCRTVAEAALAAGRPGMHQLLDDLDVRVIEAAEFVEHDPDGRIFTNVNDTGGHARAEAMLDRSG